MYKKISTLALFTIAAVLMFPAAGTARQHVKITDAHTCQNNIPPRYQWDGNSGYCGEVALISAGLYYGQYVSQYDSRTIATKFARQNKGQLLLGKNDAYAAAQMHLDAVEWDSGDEQNADKFLVWVKEHVLNGYPVAMGIYTNEFRFYGDTDPDAGDDEYDHIVPVTGVGSNHPLSDLSYYSDDIIYFSDNGLWGSDTNPPYNFCYGFDSFQASRSQANAKTGAIYSLCNDGTNYGIAITGVMDLNGDTVPVRLDTNVKNEQPAIKDGSNTRPDPMSLTLTVTVSNLQPGIVYNLYRYNNFDAVPDRDFNANAGSASQSCVVQIASGKTFVMTQQISSDEIAVYRAVKASAP